MIHPDTVRVTITVWVEPVQVWDPFLGRKKTMYGVFRDIGAGGHDPRSAYTAYHSRLVANRVAEELARTSGMLLRSQRDALDHASETDPS